ncbi:histidinol-phosphate aminotransferase [Chitinivorax tropicus]|uniref:Histidinol-phosphate aminotransferase n=1 Tax=Chitinivorax tropicus TaxID=714531 RepID=A0A840MV81_9PROT|nr:histidinol-phosphate transaminase [Chitinivorax tropicus]MBB5019081.1 histidinol-phosphate aminotransferase [Chitinivorax tropicus]
MTTPEQLIRPEILAMSAYHVPPASKMVKLDAMENPYRLPTALRQQLGQGLGDIAINRYPDAGYGELKGRLRRIYNLPEQAAVMLGNGSDELIQILAMGLARPGAKLMSLEPSFVMYRMIATFCQMQYVGVPLREDFTLDIEATLATIEREQPALIFIAYPNNPTGNHFPAEHITRIIRAAKGLVVVDEAYEAFARDSFLPKVTEFPNLLILRTLSKIGMAGLRLGFMVGAPAWINEFEKLRPPYNVNVLTQYAVETLLDQIDVLREQTEQIKQARMQQVERLATLPTLTQYPSDANFILVRVPDAPAVHAALKVAGILVKNLHGAHPLLQNCLRLTVGTSEENQLLFDALKSALMAMDA